MPPCKYCGVEIQWRKDGGKNIPINPDGSFHKSTCKGSDPAPSGNGSVIIGRITEYEGSNVHVGTKILFIPPEYRKIWQERHPVGTAVSATVDKGTCKTMDALTGPNLEKFLKSEEAARNQQTLPAANTTAQQPTVTEKPTETCTSPKDTPVQKTPPSEKDVWTAEKEMFQALLLSTDRAGMKELLHYIEMETDFFIAPSSTKYHDAVPGGLLHHSLKVYHNLVALSKTFSEDYPADSLIIIGLLHDLCKTNFYTTSTRNVKKELPGGFSEWVKEPYIDIDDKFPLGHGEKSVILILRHIKLTDTEIMGIRWHMMAYDDVKNSYAGNLAITNASDKYRIIPLMHIADLSASFLEMRGA